MLDELLGSIRVQTKKIFEAGEQSALAGMTEHPVEEANSAELRKIVAEIEILGVVGKFLDDTFFSEGVVMVEAAPSPTPVELEKLRPGAPQFPCTCGTSFATLAALRRHIGAMKRYRHRGHAEP
ncbi:MAG: hypothetical protein AB7V18_19330 [Pyrinomonadaceae bacterium]